MQLRLSHGTTQKNDKNEFENKIGQQEKFKRLKVLI